MPGLRALLSHVSMAVVIWYIYLLLESTFHAKHKDSECYDYCYCMTVANQAQNRTLYSNKHNKGKGGDYNKAQKSLVLSGNRVS